MNETLDRFYPKQYFRKVTKKSCLEETGRRKIISFLEISQYVLTIIRASRRHVTHETFFRIFGQEA
jgi:hypothetical protein